MADNTINVRIKDRSDTEANWTSKNPVLLKGERAITDGTGKYKIGDGKNTWSALPYYEAMTSADRTKLNGIASGANKTTVDSSLSSSSTNPVQNKVVNSALAGKSNTSHTHDLSTMINTLSIGSSTPTDDDYFVSQYVGGGTTTTTYYRRPVKALLEYIRGKFAKVATSGSYNDLSNKPTIPSVGNGTITIKQAGTVKGSFTTNQSGATTIELTDNNTNTWRDVVDNLTSTATDKSLSAKQGKLLNDNKAEIREWSAQIKCATWSRLCYVEQKGSVIGSSFILNISGTRNAVVYNDTFVIKVHHSQKATISKISGSTYSTGIQVRVVSDSSGNCYVEMYEDVNGATNTTTQIVYCSLIDIACGAITTYTSFTNGASIPTGFTSNATITTNSNSLQGNLTWGEITGKPSFKTVATSGSYNDLSNKPTIGNGTVTITQGGTSKGTFTLNQTGNTTIALTDNNSWRGIQNNLTSTSTTDSLSAAQGKVLNDKFASYVPTSRTVNGKALSANISLNASDVGASASGHTHNYVKDAGNNSSNTTFAYSKAGMNYGDYAWLAGWNGYELRAVSKSQFATAGHTHNYAGSSSAGGSANSAVKLATARSVSNTEDFVMNFSYDGSANSNASLRYYNSRISVGNTNNYPYHRFAKIDTQTSSYIDKTSTFLITQDYNDGGWGIVRISLRTNNSSSVSAVEAKWLVRCGLNVDCVQIGLYNVFGKTYADAFFKTSGAYVGTVIRNLASGARGNISRTWILTDSAEANSTTTSDKKTSTESYASTSAAATTLHSQAYTSVVVASDGGTVSYANSAGNASKVNNHTVNSNVPSGAKFTDTVYSHPTTSGNKHIPSGGSSGQILRWSSDGTAVWGNDNNTTYTLSSITGTLAVSKGGTGSTTASGGRSNLGAVGFVCQSTEPSGQNNGDLWFKEE